MALTFLNSAMIEIPARIAQLSADTLAVSSLDVTGPMLSAGTDLLSVFLTPANTLTTTVTAVSSDNITPFAMSFINGLLTSVTVLGSAI